MRHDERESDEPVFEPSVPRPKASRRKGVKNKRRRTHGHVQHDDHKITGPCFVYLLVHLQDARFKIGVSRAPEYRLQLLPDAEAIDQDHSLKAELPSSQRAHQVESMLHKALSGFQTRIQRKPGDSQDGDTEWFHLEGFAKACELLSLVPIGANAAVPDIRYFDGRLWSSQAYRWHLPFTPAQKRWQDAGDFNVQRMRHIYSHLVALELRCHIVWKPAVSAHVDALGRSVPARPAILVIRNLKNCWDPWALSARFEVVSSALWQFQTGRKSVGQSTHSLASLIRYSPQSPADLEVVLGGLGRLGDLPAGDRVQQLWHQIRWL